ncbi:MULTISPECIES: hypothetical protein [unclassified Thermosipho (in: thermotogales)]|uniref:hypothetical protein n=1 Tax=unclassified Thermosipho (in: thermotogales) TaxID=2676525 RepID=UPI0009876AFB|nr:MULTISPECIES: hypothetical protein [unclassified Thermosipho (in: thermotogales)]MBT1247349.1 hypothetical protein [Thermosipho sp. 1244]OOC46949.1 hypothetical protein XO09_04115 [Thermosipho sp. 1223]
MKKFGLILTFLFILFAFGYSQTVLKIPLDTQTSVNIQFGSLNSSTDTEIIIPEVFFEMSGNNYIYEYMKSTANFAGVFLTVLSILISLSVWSYNRIVDKGLPEKLVQRFMGGNSLVYLSLFSIFFVVWMIVSIFLYNKFPILSDFIGVSYMIIGVLLYYRVSILQYKPEKIIDRIISKKNFDDVLNLVKNLVKYDKKELFSYVLDNIFKTKDQNFIKICLGNRKHFGNSLKSF